MKTMKKMKKPKNTVRGSKEMARRPCHIGTKSPGAWCRFWGHFACHFRDFGCRRLVGGMSQRSSSAGGDERRMRGRI